jgi:predicted regulator of Ras-like GTPase activity (Roadblock/LC7/MglB family)
VADDVRLWSDELARDPSSLVFLPLAETLRQRGQLDLARKVATRGLERHSHNPDAHDLLARIHADLGDLQSAFDEWDTALRLAPGHVGATKGMAFLRFQQGELAEAERLLHEADATRGDAEISAAINTVRRSSGIAPVPMTTAEMSADPRLLFADVLESEQTAIMLDKDGLVLAGSYYAADGRDVAEDVGVSLSGVSSEALRACKHLGMGGWRSIVFETEAAVVSIVPAPVAGGLAAGGLLVIAAATTTPLGLLRRFTDRCVARAAAWLAGGERGS